MSRKTREEEKKTDLEDVEEDLRRKVGSSFVCVHFHKDVVRFGCGGVRGVE